MKKITHIKWWERFLLLFRRCQSSVDVESGFEVVCIYKELFGKTYILQVYQRPPQHINCRCHIEPIERNGCVAGCPECTWGGKFPAKDYCEGYEPPEGKK